MNKKDFRPVKQGTTQPLRYSLDPGSSCFTQYSQSCTVFGAEFTFFFLPTSLPALISFPSSLFIVLTFSASKEKLTSQ